MSEQAPSPVIHLREFNIQTDYAAVIELWSSAGPGVHLGRSDSPEEIRKKLGRDPDLFLVAEAADGKMVGVVIGGYDGRRGMVYHLAVQPGLRGRGVGSALMAELERRLRGKGCIRAYLMVVPGNDEAAQYYLNRGWQVLPVTTYAKDLSE